VKAASAQPSVAVLGAGSIGRRHLKNLRALGVEGLVGFEPNTARREDAERETATPIFAELEAVWEYAPQAVVVAAPTQYHLPLTRAAVEHGAHVFIEKPLAHTLDGLDDLGRMLVARGLISMIGCNMRFHPGPMAVRRLLSEGAVGAVINARVQASSWLPRWRPTQDYRQNYSASPAWGGAILDCIHEIDLAFWYFGSGHLHAAATLPATPLGLQTDGLAELLIAHDSGVLSSVTLNFMQQDYRRGCQIAGTRGTIYWDFAERRVWTHDESGQLDRSIPEPDRWDVNQMYVDEMAYFLEAVRLRQPAMNPISEALATLTLALEARDPKWSIAK